MEQNSHGLYLQTQKLLLYALHSWSLAPVGREEAKIDARPDLRCRRFPIIDRRRRFWIVCLPENPFEVFQESVIDVRFTQLPERLKETQNFRFFETL